MLCIVSLQARETGTDIGEGQEHLWPSPRVRDKWIRAVSVAKTKSAFCLGLQCLLERAVVSGIVEDTESVSRRKKQQQQKAFTEVPRRDRKDKMKVQEASRSNRRQTKRVDYTENNDTDEDDGEADDDWDEVCTKCKKVGKMICCDGCTAVFHLKCAGLSGVPKGEFYCDGCKQLRDNISKHTGEDDHWERLCSVCERGGTLLCCDGCPKAFHLQCSGLSKMPEENEDWFCVDCAGQACGVCNKVPKVDNHIICGDENGKHGCEKVFHLECVGLKVLPEGDWFCPECRRQLGDL